LAFAQTDPATVQIHPSWKERLAGEFAKPYFGQIKSFLLSVRRDGKTIYPPGPQIFNAFNSTPFDAVRVVIIGQDPYHGPGQAMGLSFSVPRGVAIPASLRNIYRELQRDLGIPPPGHGDLSAWTRQGVFLLNAILTVEKNQAGSHSRIGWQLFTDEVIRQLNQHRTGLFFLLWGNYARSKKDVIDPSRHTVLEAAHPSPLARDAFMGCGHFSAVNRILHGRGEPEINWTLDA
jgi:uracil-DNA glycosylase